MGISLKNIGKKITDFASKGYDQVNMFDNGRTFKQRTPVNNRSVIGQASHNAFTNTAGNIAVKPIANTVSGTIIEPARSLVADFTGNRQARQAAETRKMAAIDSSIPGFIINSAKNVIDIPVQIGTDVAVNAFGSPEARRVRDGQTMQTINKTPFGQVFSPIQHTLAGNQVIRDNPRLTPEQQLELKEQSLSRVGLDPGASIGKQMLETATAAMELYGTATAPDIVQNPAGYITDQLDLVSNGAKFVKQAPAKTVEAVKPVVKLAGQKINEATMLPNIVKLTDNELYTLADFGDMKLGIDKTPMTNMARNNVNVHARQIAQKAGIDVVTGSPAEIHKRIADFVEDYTMRMKATSQSGHAQVEIPLPKSKDVKSGSKKTVKMKNEPPVDPTDPFGNRGFIKKLRNELGSAVDDDAQMINMLRKIEKQTGRKGLVDQWYTDTNAVKLSTSRANAKMMEDADLKESYRGLSKDDLAEFDKYSTARRELSYDEKMKTSRSRAELKKTVDAGQAKYGERFDARKRSIDKITDELQAEGIITADRAKELKANKDYVRIQRDMEDLLQIQRPPSNSRSFGSTTTGQRTRGSKREALSAAKTDLQRRQQLEREIQRNKAASNILDTLEENGLATKVKNGNSKNTIARFKNGKKEFYEVHPDIKKVIENVSPYNLGIIKQIISVPVRTVRAGLTGLNPAFAVVNYLRDQGSSALLSKDVLRTHNPANIISGIYNATKGTLGENDNVLWKKFMEFAGDQTVYDDLRNTKSADKMLRELRMGGAGKAINMARAPLRTVEDIISITEKATRFQNFKAVYNKAIKEKLTEGEAYSRAYLAAAQNSVDFNRSSGFTRTMNLIFPYFNASVQGSRSMARAFRDRPLQTSVKSLAFVAMPAMAATAYNLSDPDRRAAYESITEYEKEDNFIIITPWAEQKADGSWEGIIKIPKPQGFREITQPLQDVTESFITKQPMDEGIQIAQQILEGITGPIQIGSVGAAIGSVTPQQVKPFVQQGMNQDLYSGKEIVPDYMKADTDDPSKWEYDSSSGTAKILGRLTNRSPIQVEKFTKDVLGGTGANLLNASDNLLAKTGVIGEDEIGGRSVLSEVSRRLTQASGELLEDKKSSGRKYYETVEDVIKGAKFNKNEQAAWDTLHPSKTNFMGEEIFDENKRLANYTRASMYLQHPKVFAADAEIDNRNRAAGKPGNPLYRLPKDQLTRVLLKATLPPGATDPELSNLYKEEWYQDYNNERDKYYQGVKAQMQSEGKEMPAQKNPYPETPSNLQKTMDEYSALPKGTGERSAWIKANPGLWQQMTNQWSAVDAWENKERVDMGLSAIVKDDTTGTSGYGSGGSKYGPGGISNYGTSNQYRYRVGLNAGGDIAKPKVSVKSAGKAPARKSAKKSGPKVSLKKSLV